MSFVVRLFLCFSLFFSLSTLHAQEEESTAYTPLDFDADGQSDIGLFENQADGSPNELVHNIQLSDDESELREEYGKSSDKVAYGDYDGDGTWEIVFVRDNEETLDWYTFDEKTPSINFGQTDDVILSGCDFDQDGKTDRAVIRESALIVSQSSDSELISTDLELGDSMSIQSALCFDLDNDEALEFLFLGSRLVSDDSEKPEREKCRKLYRGKKKRKACRARNKLLRENNSRSESREDILLVLDADGTFQSKHKAKKATVPVVADLDSDGTYEVGFFKYRKRGSQLHFFLLNEESEAAAFRKQKIELPLGTTDVSLVKRDVEDIPTDFLFLLHQDESVSLFDLETLSTTSNADTSVSGDTLIHSVNVHYTGSGVPEDPEGVCDSVEDFSDGANGRVWKASDHGGTAVFVRPICDGSSKRVYIMRDGVIHGEMYYTGLANPDACGMREHWRHSKRTSDFPARSIIVVEMRSGGTNCYQLGDNPGKRHD